MKFLLSTLEYFPFKGGIANYYTNLVYYWPKDSQIFVLNNKNDLLAPGGLFPWRRAIRSLNREIKNKKIDHVIVGHILPLGIAMYIVNKFRKTKYSVILHGLDFSWATKNSWKRFISFLILKKADKIIVANTYTFNLVKDFFFKKSPNKQDCLKKIKIINPGVKDFSDFHQSKKTSKIEKIRTANGLKEEFILFSLGRLVKRKGVDKVILALKKIFEERPNLNLSYIIAGQGPDEAYLKDVLRANFQKPLIERIKFIGEISEAEKWSLLSLSDLFIMPSRNISGDFEGFGIVYLEANLCAKAVIGGDSGGVADAIAHQESGLLVNPEKEEEIAKAILLLIDNPLWRKKLGEQGRQRALIKFNWKNQIENLYYFLNN